MNERAIIAAAYLLAIVVAPVFAQGGTQPPNAAPPNTGSQVSLCHYDSNDGHVYPEVKPRDQVNEDELGAGVATEGKDTRPDDQRLCQQAITATPTPGAVEVASQRATPTPPPTTALSVPSPTPTATDAPTSTPAPIATATATPVVLVPEPTVPDGPLPTCSPDQEEGTPCQGK